MTAADLPWTPPAEHRTPEAGSLFTGAISPSEPYPRLVFLPILPARSLHIKQWLWWLP